MEINAKHLQCVYSHTLTLTLIRKYTRFMYDDGNVELWHMIGDLAYK